MPPLCSSFFKAFFMLFYINDLFDITSKFMAFRCEDIYQGGDIFYDLFA